LATNFRHRIPSTTQWCLALAAQGTVLRESRKIRGRKIGEYLRPLEKPAVPKEQAELWKLWNRPHIAYRVDDLEAALQGEQVVLGPFDPGGFGLVAFIIKDGAVVEYIQYTDLSHWFGQLNPPGWTPEEF
jgi:hypothetical protein